MQARGGSDGYGRRHAPAASSGRRPLRIAVIGAGRARQGTGPFVARQLVEHGTEVVAVSTTSSATADACAAQVSALTQRPCQAFTSAAAMLESTDLDAVAICSPAAAHAEHLRLALHFALDTFCEKPLVEGTPPAPALAEAREIVAAFAERGVVLHVNTQWTYTLRHLAALYGLDATPSLRSLRVELRPPVRGPAMVPEAVPHANSLLLALSAAGEAGDLHVSMSPEQDTLDVDFTWNARSAGGARREPAEVAYRLRWCDGRPRDAAFEVNGMRVDRTVDMTAGYTIAFTGNGRTTPAADPLAASVQAFVEAVRDPFPAVRYFAIWN